MSRESRDTHLRSNTAIQTDTIKVAVSMSGMSLSLSTVVPRNGTSKKARAEWTRELADQIADMIEMPRRVKNV